MISDIVRRQRREVDLVVIAGGLGGTPDDVTRQAIAHAFDVDEEGEELARSLSGTSAYAAAFAGSWSRRPRGSSVLRGLEGGAPGFAIDNVFVLPGYPPEMKAMFADVRRVAESRHETAG